MGLKLFGTTVQYVVENMVGVHGMMNYVDARTQFFDEMVNSALDAGIRQVVVLAAGYDTRPYRLCRPFVKVSMLTNGDESYAHFGNDKMQSIVLSIVSFKGFVRG
jgi:Leucine carboxyl methyltransferase